MFSIILDIIVIIRITMFAFIFLLVGVPFKGDIGVTSGFRV